MTSDVVDDWSRILWVEDNAAIVRALGRHWAFPAMPVVETAEEALVKLEAAALAGEPYLVLIADYVLPGMDGVALCEQARKISEMTRRVIVSAYTELLNPVQLMNDGVVQYVLPKPFSVADMQGMFRRLMLRRRDDTTTASGTRLRAVDAEELEQAVREKQDAMRRVIGCTMPFVEARRRGSFAS